MALSGSSAATRRRPPIWSVLLLAGCGAPSLPELNVEQQWRAALERQALYALFPITEDIMVGDVMLDTRRAPDTTNDRFKLVRIARTPRADVLKALCDSRRERIVVAPFPAALIADAAQRAAAERQNLAGALENRFDCDAVQPDRPELAAPAIIGSAYDINSDLRLSFSDIPETTVARLTTAQLAGAGFFGNFGANLGLTSAGRVALTIKLKDLQSLQIEPTQAVDMLDELRRRNTAVNPGPVLAVMAQQWPEGGRRMCEGRWPSADQMSVTIVTRVEYAGGVDFEFTEGSETALRAALDLASLAEGAAQSPIVPSLPTGGAADPGKPAEAGPSAAITEADRLARRLSALLSGVTGISAASGGAARMGVNTSLAIGSSGRLGLQSAYGRPMAVGAGTTLRFPPEAALLVTQDEPQQDIDRAIRVCGAVLKLDLPAQVGEDPIDWCARTLEGPASRLSRLKDHLCRQV